MLENIMRRLGLLMGLGALIFMFWIRETSTNNKDSGTLPFIGVIVYMILCYFGPEYLKQRVDKNTDKVLKKIPFISVRNENDNI